MEKDIDEPLMPDLGNFKYSVKELGEIANPDNRYQDEKSDFPKRIISSGIIMERFGGPAAIAASLGTNLKTGIPGD